MPDLSAQKLVAVRFSEQIATRIEALILGSELKPGDKLPSERELAESFGVSRSVVREALKLLSERGLVQSRMGQGSFVSDPGLSNVISSLSVAYHMRESTVDNLMEVRLHLELPIAVLAAQRATPADVERLESAIESMDARMDALHDPQVLKEFQRADADFHTALATATHNPVFVILSNSIFDILLAERSKMSRFKSVTQEGHKYHKQVLECVKRRDSSGAEQAMKRHLEHTAAVRSQFEGGSEEQSY